MCAKPHPRAANAALKPGAAKQSTPPSSSSTRAECMLCEASAHSASSGDDDRRRAFPPPRRWWQPCVTPYFADLGVGDMRGARASNIHRHPGGGGRLSVATKRLPSPPSWRQYQPGATPHRQCRERQRATPSAPSPLSFPRSSLTLPRRLKPAMLHYALLHHDTHPADSRR